MDEYLVVAVDPTAVDPADAELAADAAWAAGATAVVEESREGNAVLVVGFADAEALARAESVLAARWPVRRERVDPTAGDEWREHARPVAVGRRLLVVPAWWTGRVRDGPERRTILIDPGRSYGLGDHPSTRLALELLEAIVQPGDGVLDVGCGSGVLSVAAVALGAGHATAIDVDAGAVDDTRANAVRNDMAGLIHASTAPLETVSAVFGVVVVNLGGTAAVEDLARPLAARVAPGGTLVVSGMLDGAEGRVIAALTAEGLRLDDRRSLDGWTAVALRR